MATSKKAMIEARKARVPLSRVAIQLRRSEKRIRSRVAALAVLLLVSLTGVGSVLVHQRPLDAVFAMGEIKSATHIEDVGAIEEVEVQTPKPEQITAVAEPAGGSKSVIDLSSDGRVSPTIRNRDEIRSTPIIISARSIGDNDHRKPASEETIAQDASSELAAPTDAPNLLNAATVVESAQSNQQTALNPPPPPTGMSSDIVERIHIVSASPARDIVQILQPTEDKTCTQDLKAAAEKATLYFPLSSVVVAPDDVSNIKAFLAALKKCPSVRVDVGGHTDKTGEQILNLQMSWQRAENVIKYLRSIGADTSQFSPVGFSSTRPLYTEQTGLAQAKNRRVEFVVR